MTDHERPFFLPKEILDTGNSISWFFMDACWMMGAHSWAYALVIPTVASGLLLLYIEKRHSVFFINLAINCWIAMNTLWMFADTFKSEACSTYAKFSLGLGLSCIFLAIVTSKDVKETFSHFKRFRGIKL